MTVAELIAHLSAFPSDMRVLTPNGDHPSYVDCDAPEKIRVTLCYPDVYVEPRGFYGADLTEQQRKDSFEAVLLP